MSEEEERERNYPAQLLLYIKTTCWAPIIGSALVLISSKFQGDFSLALDMFGEGVLMVWLVGLSVFPFFYLVDKWKKWRGK